MSKKIMKRSLALGALMAFVITGSAMAAETSYIDTTLSDISEKLVITGADGDTPAIKAINKKVDIDGCNSIELDGEWTNGTADRNIFLSRTISSSDPRAILNIGSSEQPVDIIDTEHLVVSNDGGYGHVVFQAWSADMNVNAKSIELHNFANAFYAQDGGKLTVNANDIVLKTNGRWSTINLGTNADGTNKTNVTINTDNLLIEAKNGWGLGAMSGYNGTPGKQLNGELKVIANQIDIDAKTGIEIHDCDAGTDSKIDIDTNVLNITSYDTGIKASYKGKVEIAAKDNSSTNTTTINTTGGATGNTFGVYAQGNSSVTFVGDTTINVKSTATEETDNVIGILSKTGSVVEFKDASNINITATATGGCTAVGVQVQNSVVGLKEGHAKVNLFADNINITCSSATAGSATGLTAISGSELNVEGNLTVNAVNGNAIAARGGSLININTQGNNNIVKLTGDIVYDYNEINSGSSIDADINLDLTNKESFLTGKIIKDDKAPDGKNDVAGMTLGLYNGAKWNVTGDSFVNIMNGSDGNVVLATENAESDDTLDVATVDIGINNNTNLTVSGDEKLTKAIEEGKVSADEALATLSSSAKVEDEANSKDIATIKTVEGKILGSYVLTENGPELQESSMSAAVSEAGMNLKAHWRAHMNDMNKRMGELRMANGETGVWTRMVRGESEYEGAKMQYNQYQLGYDEKLSVDKRWTVGAAVTFAEGDSSYAQGSSEDKSTAFAIYGTKLNNDGTFVDLIARYARLESDIEDSVYKNGEYDTNGMSVSAEFGKRIQQGNGLWIEPQVELTYGTVDSATVKFADGSIANYGDMDSFIGRVGFRLGKDIKQGNVYARASYLYDFDGETETTFGNGTVSGKPVSEDFGGGWWEVGVGANINLSKATYIYADVEKTFGGEVDTNWQWNLGVRYSF